MSGSITVKVAPWPFPGLSAATLPLTVWTYTIIPVYLVWDWAQYGARWRVPDWLMVIEYALVLAAMGLMRWRSRKKVPVRSGEPLGA